MGISARTHAHPTSSPQQPTMHIHISFSLSISPSLCQGDLASRNLLPEWQRKETQLHSASVSAGCSPQESGPGRDATLATWPAGGCSLP